VKCGLHYCILFVIIDDPYVFLRVQFVARASRHEPATVGMFHRLRAVQRPRPNINTGQQNQQARRFWLSQRSGLASLLWQQFRLISGALYATSEYL